MRSEQLCWVACCARTADLDSQSSSEVIGWEAQIGGSGERGSQACLLADSAPAVIQELRMSMHCGSPSERPDLPR
jgi:hypothetical protein